MDFERALVGAVLKGLGSGPELIQVLVGPRQVGKTTVALQVEQRAGLPTRFASADAPLPHPPEWIETQWQLARMRLTAGDTSLLVLDEIQKVRGWSEVVKRLWDEDRRAGRRVHVILLGSSALLVQRGLSESLAGRFYLHRCPHWSFGECRDAFGWTLPQWIFFGGYPGAAPFIADEPSWKRYITDSLIETVLSRDVLQLETVTKPALLRHLFALAAQHPAQIFSYNKMLGQLQDAGNTVTLAGYLRLLETAFLASGLELFSRGTLRKRGSSPKLVLWNNALINATSLRSFAQATRDGPWWGHLVENAVGAHLLNHLQGPPWSVSYWRDGPREVDFVVGHGTETWALEVKSGRDDKIAGLAAFVRKYPDTRTWLIGETGVPLEEFFLRPAQDWFTP